MNREIEIIAFKYLFGEASPEESVWIEQEVFRDDQLLDRILELSDGLNIAREIADHINDSDFSPAVVESLISVKPADFVAECLSSQKIITSSTGFITKVAAALSTAAAAAVILILKKDGPHGISPSDSVPAYVKVEDGKQKHEPIIDSKNPNKSFRVANSSSIVSYLNDSGIKMKNPILYSISGGRGLDFIAVRNKSIDIISSNSKSVREARTRDSIFDDIADNSGEEIREFDMFYEYQRLARLEFAEIENICDTDNSDIYSIQPGLFVPGAPNYSGFVSFKSEVVAWEENEILEISEPLGIKPMGTDSVAFRVIVASDTAGIKNPFDIFLTGRSLSFTQDSDGDGLNDAAEFQMAAPGFDWQVNQAALVNAYHAAAGGAGLFTASQIQDLNISTPLLELDATTGKIKLIIDVAKSTAPASGSFLHFPMSEPQTTINADGKLEFLFTVPEDTAFFRLQAQ